MSLDGFRHFPKMDIISSVSSTRKTSRLTQILRIKGLSRHTLITKAAYDKGNIKTVTEL